MPQYLKLSPVAIAIIASWYAQPGRKKKPPKKVVAHLFGVSATTLWKAATGKEGYR